MGQVGCANSLFKAHGGEIREVYGFWEHAAAPLPSEQCWTCSVERRGGLGDERLGGKRSDQEGRRAGVAQLGRTPQVARHRGSPPRPKKELSSGQGEFSVDRCPQTLHYIPNVSPSCRAEDFVISLQEAHHLAPARASTDQLAVDELRSGLRDLPPKQVMYVCTRSDDISRNELTGNLDMAASTTNERQ